MCVYIVITTYTYIVISYLDISESLVTQCVRYYFVYFIIPRKTGRQNYKTDQHYR